MQLGILDVFNGKIKLPSLSVASFVKQLFMVFVLNTGMYVLQVKQMPKLEKQEMIKMLKLVQRAQKEITKEHSNQSEKTIVLGLYFVIF